MNILLDSIEFPSISMAKQNIRKQFLEDERTHIQAFSGGKDSSLLLHLFLEMLLDLKNEGIKTRKSFIVTSDTGVEMPMITGYVRNKLASIEQFIKKEKLNVEVKVLKPEINDGFYVCLIGRGFASPNQRFRWCTDRLKILPGVKYLTSLAKVHKSIILHIGVRTDESIARAESINKRDYNSRDLTIHDKIPNAYNYSPLKNVGTTELWRYLTKVPALWGTHRDMMKLYDKGSSEADCNVVLNPNSESCGKTRFGCSVCTVSEDKSMQGMLLNGEEWMKPLFDFRNKIFDYRYDHSKRRDKNSFGMNVAGKFLLSVRKELLEDILRDEAKMKDKLIEKTGSAQLISNEEIIAINKFWKKDGDFSNEALKLANKYGRNLQVPEANTVDIKNICDEVGIDALFFAEVISINQEHRHSLRRIGIANEQKELVKNYVQGEVHEDK